MNVKECESIDNEEARLQQHAKTDDDQDLNSLFEVGADVNVNTNDSSTRVAVEERKSVDSDNGDLHKPGETTDNKELNRFPETRMGVNNKEIESIDNEDLRLHQCGNELNSLLETRTDVNITDGDSNVGSTTKGTESVQSEEMGLYQLDETGDNEDFDSLPETGTNINLEETCNDEPFTETINDVNVKGIGFVDNEEQELPNLAETFDDKQLSKLVETGADVDVKDNDSIACLATKGNGSIDNEEAQLPQLPETHDDEQLYTYVKKGADVNVKEIESIDNEEIGLHNVVETDDDDDNEQFDRISERGGYVNVSEFGSTDSLTGTDEKEEINSLTRAGEETESFNSKEMALHEIVEIGDGEQLKELIPRGVDVNVKDCEGNTALAIAARSGHIDCVNILITAGADVNIVNDEGISALIYAVGHGHPDCAQILIDAGADVNHTDYDGSTALIWAATNCCSESIEILLNAGADVNKVNKNSTTALLEAAMINYMPCVKRLAQVGADVNGDLICAAQNGDTTCINALIKVGADVITADAEGNTPLIWATENGYSFCVDVLLQAGRM